MTSFFYKGKEHEEYLTHVKMLITAARKDIYLILVYGLSKHPMMLATINALNFYITVCIAFLAHISMKPETNALKVSIPQKADPVKEKVRFCYYRLAKGVADILSSLNYFFL